MGGVQDRRARLPQQPPRERVDGVRDLAINCSKKPETGCWGRERREKTQCGSGLCTIVHSLVSPRTKRVHSDRAAT